MATGHDGLLYHKASSLPPPQDGAHAAVTPIKTALHVGLRLLDPACTLRVMDLHDLTCETVCVGQTLAVSIQHLFDSFAFNPSGLSEMVVPHGQNMMLLDGIFSGKPRCYNFCVAQQIPTGHVNFAATKDLSGRSFLFVLCTQQG